MTVVVVTYRNKVIHCEKISNFENQQYLLKSGDVKHLSQIFECSRFLQRSQHRKFANYLL